jgi:hypothetical protein
MYDIAIMIGSRGERERKKNLDWICYSYNDEREEKEKNCLMSKHTLVAISSRFLYIIFDYREELIFI